MIYQLLRTLHDKYPPELGRCHSITYNEEYDGLSLDIWISKNEIYPFALDNGDLDDIPSLLYDIDCMMKELKLTVD